MHITEAINSARQKTGKTVNGLAKEANMQQPDLWRMFKKRIDIRYSTLVRIAKALKVDVSRIVRYTEKGT